MGCCQARDESTKKALMGDLMNDSKLDDSKLNETAGIEFPINMSGVIDEEDDKLANDPVAFSTKTIEVTDSERSPVHAENVTFMLQKDDPYAADFHRASSPDLIVGRSSFASSGSDKAYTGIDQVEFFNKVIVYLKEKI